MIPWMQTPAGYELRAGIAYPTDWLAVIFNPSFPYRLAIILGYVVFVYWLFGGKLRESEGYH
jgi:cytochrome bd ubiquinol oxidase subunit I